MSKTLSVVLVASVLLSSQATFTQATDPQIGTWKLNWEKGKAANAAAKPPQVLTVLKIEPTEGGHHFVSDQVTATGQKVQIEYTAKYDGRDYPRTATTDGKPVQSTISIRKVDDYTYDYTFKNIKAEVVQTQRTITSRDGKTRTNTITTTNAEGQKTTSIVVYDRQ